LNEIAFKRRVEVKEALRSEDNVEQIWDELRQCMVKEAEVVCCFGDPKGRQGTGRRGGGMMKKVKRWKVSDVST